MGTKPPAKSANKKSSKKTEPKEKKAPVQAATKEKMTIKRLTSDVRIRKNVKGMVRIKMGQKDHVQSLKALEGLVHQISDCDARLEALKEEEKSVDEARKKVRAQQRETEEVKESLRRHLEEHITAREDGFALREEVFDEYVTRQGEIVRRKAGTMIEVGTRRTANSAELQMADGFKTADGTSVLAEDHKGAQTDKKPKAGVEDKKPTKGARAAKAEKKDAAPPPAESSKEGAVPPVLPDSPPAETPSSPFGRN